MHRGAGRRCGKVKEGIVTIDRFSLGEFVLHSGVTLPDAILTYATHGQLNDAKDNAVIVPTWYGGTDADVEWMIGSDRAVDPNRYFIIVPNMFGNGRSSSPSNTPPPSDRGRFPNVTILDNIRAQHRLVTERFGIARIALVTGSSMGAMQTFQWGASYPDMVERIAPIGGTARCTPHNQVVLEGQRAALTADPAWANGDYTTPPERGLRSFARVDIGWTFAPRFWQEEGYRARGFPSIEAFIEDWENAYLAADANNLLAMLWTWQHGDISIDPRYGGDFERALRSITARAVVLPAKTDLYFPLAEAEAEARLMPNATFQPIPSEWGHTACTGADQADADFITQQIRALLETK